jgi:hypothetical protein
VKGQVFVAGVEEKAASYDLDIDISIGEPL